MSKNPNLIGQIQHILASTRGRPATAPQILDETTKPEVLVPPEVIEKAIAIATAMAAEETPVVEADVPAAEVLVAAPDATLTPPTPDDVIAAPDNAVDDTDTVVEAVKPISKSARLREQLERARAAKPITESAEVVKTTPDVSGFDDGETTPGETGKVLITELRRISTVRQARSVESTDGSKRTVSPKEADLILERLESFEFDVEKDLYADRVAGSADAFEIAVAEISEGISELFESAIHESSPPGDEAESWVKSNKDRFKRRYGNEKGERVLYAKAWKLFG